MKGLRNFLLGSRGFLFERWQGGRFVGLARFIFFVSRMYVGLERQAKYLTTRAQQNASPAAAQTNNRDSPKGNRQRNSNKKLRTPNV
jgi:hypothetical protein